MSDRDGLGGTLEHIYASIIDIHWEICHLLTVPTSSCVFSLRVSW